MNSWTFGKKVASGYGLMFVLTVAMGVIAVRMLDGVVQAKDEVLNVNAQNVLEAVRLDGAVERRSSSLRGYFISKDEQLAEDFAAAGNEASSVLRKLKANVASEEGRRQVEDVEKTLAQIAALQDQTLQSLRSGGSLEAATRAFNQEILPKRRALTRLLDDVIAREQAKLEEGKRAASATADSAARMVAGLAAGSALLALILSIALSTLLTGQVGSAVQHIRSSSSELQAAANQQVTGAREQHAAMTEITTTVTELLATSRQIAESAQRVAQIAEQTSSAARAGDQTVQRASAAVGGIKQQVDLIVSHMLDLGRKSQQIGGILEIINELTEQTNILSINATIEAAGAGEAGKRFSAVADEIRKLADRVGGSTKEIRGLVDEIRAAVNATVMTTEGGTKAVDAGTRQFSEVASSFKQIAEMVVTTSEAAREIELSTKQQASAVEQVKLAVSNVAQATKESEASSSQTLQTATQLGTLSTDLSRLVQSEAA